MKSIFDRFIWTMHKALKSDGKDLIPCSLFSFEKRQRYRRYRI